MENEAVYIILANQGEGVFVVKFGRCAVPFNRYVELLTGIPFESEMRFAWCGNHDNAVLLEHVIHDSFKAKRLHGEWFRFKAQDGAFLADCLIAAIRGIFEFPLDWKIVTEQAAWSHRTKMRQPKPRPKPGLRRPPMPVRARP